jgi:hypothetical protein
MQAHEPQVIEEVRQALQGLRGGLVELYGGVGADPNEPQEVARRFGLNRQLTWKLARVISAPGAIDSLNHLPGQQGLELALAAFEKAGAARAAADRVRAAFAEFTRVVEAHVGGREQMEMILESMGLLEREGQADSFRERAYQGNSAIWGAQARTRAAINFVAPSAASSSLETVMVGGLIGLRRLRPDAKCRLGWEALIEEGSEAEHTAEPLNPGSESKILPQLLPEFSSPNLPALTFEQAPGGRYLVLPQGDVGNPTACDCYFGYVVRGQSAHRSPGNEFGAFGAEIRMPAELLVFDLIFHRSLAIDGTAEALLYGSPHGSPFSGSSNRDRHELDQMQDRLPMSERPLELAGSPPALSTPLVPAIGRIAEYVYKRMGWDPKEFRGLRLQVPYPPLGSTVVMRWPLPEGGR